MRSLKLAITATLVAAASALAQPTSTNTITLQAKVEGVADGTANVVVRFFDALSGGAQQGAAITLNNQPINGGVINVPVSPVDPTVFNGQTRYMELTVNGTVLSPRTLVTSVPYALVASGLRFSDSPATQIIPVSGHLVSTGGIALNRQRSDLALLDTLLGDASIGAAVARFTHGAPGPDPTVWINYHQVSNPTAFDMLRCDNGTEDTQFVVQHVGGAIPIRVGIGTAEPQSSRLHVRQARAQNFAAARFESTTQSNVPANVWLNYINSDGSLDLIRANIAGADEAFRVRADGRTEVLDLTCRVLTITGGADLAEKLSVTDPNPSDDFNVVPGMLVSIDPTGNRKFALSHEPYDRKRVGIISGGNGVAAGLVLHHQGNPDADGEHAVALTGQVWAWADADVNGPIVAGDLLTTSVTPGHAMKATDLDRARFAVVGQALTRLDSGRGWVQVLVGKQ
ncbi:MAG: hypothetical protein ACOYN0_16940 [Phycisphaerales bacterium]